MCIQMSNFQFHHRFHIYNFYIPIRISSSRRILPKCLYPSQSHVTTISILIFPYKFLHRQIPIDTCNFVRKKVITFLHHRSFLIVFFIEIDMHVLLLINYKEISDEHVNINLR